MLVQTGVLIKHQIHEPLVAERIRIGQRNAGTGDDGYHDGDNGPVEDERDDRYRSCQMLRQARSSWSVFTLFFDIARAIPVVDSYHHASLENP